MGLRIPIREQIGSIIILICLVCLGVVSVATWVTERAFVLNIRSSRLSLVASLKAAQLTSNLNLMQTSANFVSNRVIIQSVLGATSSNETTDLDRTSAARQDLQAALGGQGALGTSLSLQAMVFPRDASGPTQGRPILNATGATVSGNRIRLPYQCPDGSDAFLGDDACSGDPRNLGFPSALYPNLTYLQEHYNPESDGLRGPVLGDTASAAYTLVLGPWAVNDTFYLASQTVPIINNTSAVDTLGWLTVVMDARLILQVIDSSEGLGDTGQTLLIGPSSSINVFAPRTAVRFDFSPNDAVRFVVPPHSSETRKDSSSVPDSSSSFDAAKFPVLADAYTNTTGQLDNAGAALRTQNDLGDTVSVGYALPQTPMVDWVVLIEMATSEVWQPIDHLRDVLLACVFGTVGFMCLVSFPLAHLFSLPIRRLREATTNSVATPGETLSRSSLESSDSNRHGAPLREVDGQGPAAIVARKEGFRNPVMRWRRRRKADLESLSDERRKRAFRIPARVKEQKHWVKDELSDLTCTFNEMSDELMMQYEKLEERVQQRTAELELSKKAAEAANESKTLFIANISHELKTPLNGILGMCAVCMQEDDPIRLKRSLGIIYKSGDLLLNLLTDLLTFSKNQVGHQHLTLDEREFRLRDVSSQVLAIFEKQAKEGQIDLRVQYETAIVTTESDDPLTRIGRLEDMVLWGDMHRILQVVINLISNSLKFTTANGTVTLTIRAVATASENSGSKRGSIASRPSKKQLSSRQQGSDATLPRPATPGASSIFQDLPDQNRRLTQGPSSEFHSSPPSTGRQITFEFEVQDTGPGISEHLQSKIFEPFVQGDLGLSKKFGGTGLGLSICSQLATLMSGKIWVRSTVGIGSTFTMRIPLRYMLSRADSSASSAFEMQHGSIARSDSLDSFERRKSLVEDPAEITGSVAEAQVGRGKSMRPTPPVPVSSDTNPRLVGLSQPFFTASRPLESPGSQPAAMSRLAAEAQRGERIRVLVAEDNKVNQEVVLRMLKLEDIYDVTVAKDGQEALDFVKESMQGRGESRPFNLIFMDVQMPIVDGLESTRLIRQTGYTSPIVALTAFSEESNVKDCLESGMDFFLSKPIRRPQLKKVLKKYFPPIVEEEDTAQEGFVHRRGSGSQNTRVVALKAPPTDRSENLTGDMEPPIAVDGPVSRPASPHTQV